MTFSSLLFATVPVVPFLAGFTSAQDSCSVTRNVMYTFYGLASAGSTSKWACTGDSVTPGSKQGPINIANSGDGSYGNPGQMATAIANADFRKCHIYYVPFLKKYFRYTDECIAADSDYLKGQVLVDLWIGPNPTTPTNNPQDHDQKCESNWGNRGPFDIVIDAPSGLPTQLKTLDPAGGTCPASEVSNEVDPNYYFPDNKGTCSSSGHGGGSNGGSNPNGHTVGNPTSVVTPRVSSSSAPVGDANYQGKLAQVNSVALPIPNPAPSFVSSSISGATDNPGSFHQNEAVGNTPTTLGSVVAPSSGTIAYSATPGQWTPGLIWGSGLGTIGDPCTSKVDCHGNWICIAGKCHDNRTDKAKRGTHLSDL